MCNLKKLICLALIVLFACGCTPLDSNSSGSAPYSGYATEYLEFVPAGNWDFTFSDGTFKLFPGDSHGGFTLENLLYRPDEGGLHSVRADFSCSLTTSGTFAYNSGGVYGSLIKFYPDDTSLFPKIVNDTQINTWYVVFEGNAPLEQLGIAPDSTAEVRANVNVTSFSIHYSQHNTVNYVTIEVKPEG